MNLMTSRPQKRNVLPALMGFHTVFSGVLEGWVVHYNSRFINIYLQVAPYRHSLLQVGRSSFPNLLMSTTTASEHRVIEMARFLPLRSAEPFNGTIWPKMITEMRDAVFLFFELT